MWILCEESHKSLNSILLLLTPEEISKLKWALVCLQIEPSAQCHIVDKVRGREITFGITPSKNDDLVPDSVVLKIDQDL